MMLMNTHNKKIFGLCRFWVLGGWVGLVLLSWMVGKEAPARPVVLNQPPEKIMEVPVRAEAWGLQDLSHIHAGQLGLVRNPNNDVLQIYALRGKRPTVSVADLRSRVPGHKGNCFLVSHFDKGPTNRLGGYYNRFQRKPSIADVAVRTNAVGAPALILRFQRKNRGFCGMWMHFFDFKQNPRKRYYLNAQPFTRLTFWIRGQQGGEKILLKMADATWERKGDALPVGMLQQFLPEKQITSRWQRVVVPLQKLPKSLDRRMLASWVLEAVQGKGQIEVKTMAFCRRPAPLPKLPPMPQEKPPRHRPWIATRTPPPSRTTPGPTPARLRKATWLWETQRYLQSPAKQRELLQFLTSRHFDAVFVQIPHNPRKLLQQAPPALQVAQWQPLIAALHQHHIRVYALDGYKKYALPQWHKRVLALARRVVAYNQRVAKRSRFDGFHFDIEPYLISSIWSSRRQWLATHYLNLLSALTTLAHRHQLTMGADIPFWFDEIDPYSTSGFVVSYRGVAKSLSQHVIDIVDRVGIMDYRTDVFGADGVISHAMGELTYASQQNKQILVGLETLPLPKEFLLQFRGSPKTGWPDVSGTHPPRSYVFLLPPSPSTDRKPQALTQGTLAWVPRYRLFRWKTLLAQRNIVLSQVRYWPVHKTIYISPNKLSFAGLGAPRLHQALRDLDRELRRFSAFTGFAIHSLHSYEKLLQHGKATP